MSAPGNHSPVPILCDLDGVVWLSHRPIAGSVEAIAALRAAGHRVLFVTNNSAATLAQHEAALAKIGVPAHGDVLSSSMAAALLIQPGERVLVCGGPGVVEAIEGRGAVAVSSGTDPTSPIDAVAVGFHRDFDYEIMRRATQAVQRGARLIGTNDDATYPTPDGPIPGGGAILASIQTATGISPTIAGKPYEPMAGLVRAVLGAAAITDAVMVGDRPETDGLFAVTLGCRYAIVWSGVAVKGQPVTPEPDFAADDLGGVAAMLLGTAY
jgi:HAD superfamily hydrolase (TIGR01450 family)